mgnify:CR=1 FL=1
MKELISEYKNLSSVIDKLQSQMNNGLLEEGGIQRTTSLISKLKSEMDELYSQLDGKSKKEIDLFNSKQATKNLSEMNNMLNKIESEAVSLTTKLNSISFDHIDSSKIEKIQNELKQLINIADMSDLDLGFDDLNKILSNLLRLS